jgi:hypothetical protein
VEFAKEMVERLGGMRHTAPARPVATGAPAVSLGSLLHKKEQ